MRDRLKKIKLSKLSYGFTRLEVIFLKTSAKKNYKKLVYNDFYTVLGLGCFFFEKILPIIVLKHNLQRSTVMFAPICVNSRS